MNEQVNAEELNFRFTNFYTYYSCKCEKEKIDLKKHGFVCFSEVFERVCGNTEYNIYVCKDSAILLRNKNNYCPLSLEYIIKWLDYICSIVNMKYSINEDEMEFEDSLYKCYNIDINMDNGYNIYHKFMLTMVRYLYEWPFNVFLKDVFRLIDIEQFKEETLINLHNMVLSSTQKGRTMGYEHSLTTCYAKLISNNDIKERLKTNYQINDIFEDSFYINQMTFIEDKSMLDYWESDEKFNEKRLPIYIHNYNLLCKEREKNKINNKNEE